MIMETDRITPQQLRFAQAYAADPDHNATRALIGLGVTPVSALSLGSKWLSMPAVQQAIRDIEADNLRYAVTSPTWIVSKLADIATASPLDCYERDENNQLRLKPLEQLPRAIQKISIRRNRFGEQEVSVSMASQVQALELLGRHRAMFTDNAVVDVVLTDGDRTARAAKLAYLAQKAEALESAE